jgi:hypothetical protein
MPPNNNIAHLNSPCHLPLISATLTIRGNRMAVKIKPVQPTEIKDKKMAIEVIKQIQKPIPASVYRKLKKEAEYIDKFFK